MDATDDTDDPDANGGAGAGGLDDICDVTITADDRGWLVGFVHTLVEERLVACGNITTTPVRSVYRWEGGVEEADEHSVVLHTRRALARRVVARTEADHPYDTPQVLVVPVVAASVAYQRWVLDSTDAPGGPA